MTDPYYVNVSAINDFANCQFRWWAKWVMNWVPREEAPALKFGSLLHEVFESHAKGTPMEHAIEGTRMDWYMSASVSSDPFIRDSKLKAVYKLDELREALIQWKDQYPIQQTLEVEEPFEYKVPDLNIILRGRPDRVVLMNDLIWHVQTKGLAPATNFGIFLDLAKRSYHEHLYAEALSKKYRSWCGNCNLVYGGTLFNLIRKLKYRTGITKKKPEGEVKSLNEMFYQHPMSIDLTSSLHNNVMECIKKYAIEMMFVENDYNKTGIIPLPNEKMNGGYYGNSPDLYFRVLIGEIELGDERYFKKREDTYAPTGADED